MNSSDAHRRSAASVTLSDEPAAFATPRFWVLVVLVVALDFVTKALAVEHLTPRHIPHPVIGDLLRFTLAYNPGAAFGMHLGPASRWIFAALSVVIVFVLLRATADLTRVSPAASWGVPIVVGGAIGNLLDRIRIRDGVVDFIDIGIGDIRFWTFNIADTAVTIGAALLIAALWAQDKALQEAAKHAAAGTGEASRGGR